MHADNERSEGQDARRAEQGARNERVRCSRREVEHERTRKCTEIDVQMEIERRECLKVGEEEEK